MPYASKLTKPELIDAITNLVDDGIRKDRYGTYDEWQAAVESLLTKHDSHPQPVLTPGQPYWANRPDLGTGGVTI